MPRSFYPALPHPPVDQENYLRLPNGIKLGERNNHLQKLQITSNQLKDILSQRIIYLADNPDEKTTEKFSRICRYKNDAHVLAGAVLSGANVLVSLDKKHILTAQVRKFLKPMLVRSPKDFWRDLQKKT